MLKENPARIEGLLVRLRCRRQVPQLVLGLLRVERVHVLMCRLVEDDTLRGDALCLILTYLVDGEKQVETVDGHGENGERRPDLRVEVLLLVGGHGAGRGMQEEG